jgi:hypothetical protein
MYSYLHSFVEMFLWILIEQEKDDLTNIKCSKYDHQSNLDLRQTMTRTISIKNHIFHY